MNNKVILFDIDFTLFDVGKYRQLVFERLQQLLPDVADVPSIANRAYEEIRQEGWFEAKKFTRALARHLPGIPDESVLEGVWADTHLLSDALYPESIEVLTTLYNMHYTLGIFSSGHSNFQKSKITKLSHFFEEEHVHIHELKDEKFPEIIEKYQGKKVILVDDYIPVIEKAKKADASITAIWIKRGLLSEKVAPSQEYPPDYTISNLTELLPIIEQL